jgi:hypothetical protein
MKGIEARYVRCEAAHDRLPTLHQPRHALAAHKDALGRKLGGNGGGTIRPVRSRMDRNDGLPQTASSHVRREGVRLVHA